MTTYTAVPANTGVTQRYVATPVTAPTGAVQYTGPAPAAAQYAGPAAAVQYTGPAQYKYVATPQHPGVSEPNSEQTVIASNRPKLVNDLLFLQWRLMDKLNRASSGVPKWVLIAAPIAILMIVILIIVLAVVLYVVQYHLLFAPVRELMLMAGVDSLTPSPSLAPDISPDPLVNSAAQRTYPETPTERTYPPRRPEAQRTYSPETSTDPTYPPHAPTGRPGGACPPYAAHHEHVFLASDESVATMPYETRIVRTRRAGERAMSDAQFRNDLQRLIQQYTEQSYRLRSIEPITDSEVVRDENGVVRGAASYTSAFVLIFERS